MYPCFALIGGKMSNYYIPSMLEAELESEDDDLETFCNSSNTCINSLKECGIVSRPLEVS